MRERDQHKSIKIFFWATFLSIVSFVGASTQALSSSPNRYDGVWRVAGACSEGLSPARDGTRLPALTVGPFNVQIIDGAFAIVRERNVPGDQGVTERSAWRGRLLNNVLHINVAGSNNRGSSWDYEYLVNPGSNEAFSGQGVQKFGRGEDYRVRRTCELSLTMTEPAERSLAALERQRNASTQIAPRLSQSQNSTGQGSSVVAPSNSPSLAQSQPRAASAPPTVGSQAVANPAPGIQFVVAEGVGSDVESAVKSAAEQALRQVVGTFVSAQRQSERSVQIIDGIRSETRNLTARMSEYSQGSIRSLQVLEQRQDGPLLRISARVGVKIEDFRAYINQIVSAEVQIDRGLFAAAAVEQSNRQGKSEILAERIVRPLLQGQGLSFQVGDPYRATATNFPCGPTHGRGDRLSYENFFSSPTVVRVECTDKEARTMFRALERGANQPYYIFPVQVRFDQAVAEAIWSDALKIGNNRIISLEPHVCGRASYDSRLFCIEAASVAATVSKSPVPQLSNAILLVRQRGRSSGRVAVRIDDVSLSPLTPLLPNFLSSTIHFEIQAADETPLISYVLSTNPRSGDNKTHAGRVAIVGYTPNFYLNRGAFDSRGFRSSPGPIMVLSVDRTYVFFIIAHVSVDILRDARKATISLNSNRGEK